MFGIVSWASFASAERGGIVTPGPGDAWASRLRRHRVPGPRGAAETFSSASSRSGQGNAAAYDVVILGLQGKRFVAEGGLTMVADAPADTNLHLDGSRCAMAFLSPLCLHCQLVNKVG